MIFIEPFNFSFFSLTGSGTGLDYRGIEWFALETNRDHSVVFETASKYCISESFVDHDGYSISSEGFPPAVVDIIPQGLTECGPLEKGMASHFRILALRTP